MSPRPTSTQVTSSRSAVAASSVVMTFFRGIRDETVRTMGRFGSISLPGLAASGRDESEFGTKIMPIGCAKPPGFKKGRNAGAGNVGQPRLLSPHLPRQSNKVRRGTRYSIGNSNPERIGGARSQPRPFARPSMPGNNETWTVTFRQERGCRPPLFPWAWTMSLRTTRLMRRTWVPDRRAGISIESPMS